MPVSAAPKPSRLVITRQRHLAGFVGMDFGVKTPGLDLQAQPSLFGGPVHHGATLWVSEGPYHTESPDRGEPVHSHFPTL